MKVGNPISIENLFRPSASFPGQTRCACFFLPGKGLGCLAKSLDVCAGGINLTCPERAEIGLSRAGRCRSITLRRPLGSCLDHGRVPGVGRFGGQLGGRR